MKKTYKIPEKLNAQGLRFAIVGSEYYQEAIDRMIDATQEVFKQAGVKKENCEIFRVPGSFEIPVMCKHLCDMRRFDALLTFGVILRGETAHFDQMVQSIPMGLVQLSVSTGIPIINEIIAADREDLIEARTRGPCNKGYEAGIAAVKIATVLAEIRLLS